MRYTRNKWTLQPIDGCECVIEYWFDADLPNDQIWHHHVASHNLCPAHEGLVGQDHCDTLHREAHSRGKALGAIHERVPRLKDHIPTFTWTGVGNARQLTVEFPEAALNANERGQLAQAMAGLQTPNKVAHR